jgi:hypothetical protein
LGDLLLVLPLPKHFSKEPHSTNLIALSRKIFDSITGLFVRNCGMVRGAPFRYCETEIRRESYH